AAVAIVVELDARPVGEVLKEGKKIGLDSLRHRGHIGCHRCLRCLRCLKRRYEPPALRGVVLFFWAPRAGLLALFFAPPPSWFFWLPRMLLAAPRRRSPRLLVCFGASPPSAAASAAFCSSSAFFGSNSLPINSICAISAASPRRCPSLRMRV